MTEGLGIPQLHYVVSQQAQRPMRMPRRGRGTGRRDHLGALLVGQFRRLARTGPIVQGRFDTFLNAALPGMAESVSVTRYLMAGMGVSSGLETVLSWTVHAPKISLSFNVTDY